MGGTTWYLHGDNNALVFEKELKANGVTENRHYLQAAGMTFALVTTRSGTGVSSTASDLSKRSAQVRYFHQDHLNSMAVITDEAGQVVERLAYDPWGKRRNANGLADKNDSLVGQTTDRGYTEHEHLDEVGLIHMNGRVYDPLIGRFMSADPFIQSPGNLQSYNRYAYVMNNPLAFTDPSGYFLKGLVKGLGSLLRSFDSFRRDVIRETGKAINTVISPLPSSLQGVAIAAVSVAVCGPGAPACAAGMTASVTATAAYGAGASSSDALRAGAIAGGTAYAFSWAGDVYGNGANPVGGYAAHAAVGCASSVASGGNCAQGGAAAMFGKYATVAIGGTPGQFNGYQMAATMVAGGVGSVIAGGKFENGATTAAFGYLFNQLGARFQKPGQLCGPEMCSGGGAGAAKGSGRLPGPATDKAGNQIDRIIVDSKGNAMIEPVGGSTVAAGRGGVDTHTLYPNGSNYQRLNPQGHTNNPTPHGHGHALGTGPGMRGQGSSLDIHGNVVPWNSPAAHWPIN